MERPGASQGFGFINVPEHLAGMFSGKLWEEIAGCSSLLIKSLKNYLGFLKIKQKNSDGRIALF